MTVGTGAALKPATSDPNSGNTPRSAQLSAYLRPVLVPPWNFTPPGSRALTLMSMPSKTSFKVPTFLSNVMTLSVRPNCAGLTL